MTKGTLGRVQIAIAGLPNLRDLGGWSVGNGRRVACGQMFRSTDLDQLDSAGLDAVGRLHIRTVIDFRTEAERIAKPDRAPSGAMEIVCDVLGDAPNAAPAQLPRVLADPSHASELLGNGKAVALFERGYRDLVGLPSALAAYRQFFATLAVDERRPILFHCTTGKDRTGWAAAVTLTLLGVSREDILQDYMLTNDQLLPALSPIFNQFKAAGGDPALLEPVFGVRQNYLEAAFNEARQRYGSIDGYLSDGLGIDNELRRRLQDGLTEEVTS